MTDKRASRNRELWQFIKFNVVGAMNTFVDMAVYYALIAMGVGYGAAQVCGYACGMINSYLWNKSWTFRHTQAREPETDRRAGKGRLIRFAVLNAATLGLSLALLYVAVTVNGWSQIWSKLAVTAVTTVINFTGSRLWVFKPEKGFK